MLALTSSISLGAIALTVAWVPTGINTGVSKLPWGVYTLPNLAPLDEHCLINSNLKLIFHLI
jgi:hypothetical protein